MSKHKGFFSKPNDPPPVFPPADKKTENVTDPSGEQGGEENTTSLGWLRTFIPPEDPKHSEATKRELSMVAEAATTLSDVLDELSEGFAINELEQAHARLKEAVFWANSFILK